MNLDSSSKISTGEANDYIENLVSLHMLLARGESHSENADSLREHLAMLWESYSESDRKALDGLSADLYMLSGKEIPYIYPEYKDLTEELIRKTIASEARDVLEGNNKNPFPLLEMLRAQIFPFPKDRIAYVRGRIWKELGYGFIGYLFMDYAFQVAQENESYLYLALDSLRSSNHRELCFNKAMEITEKVYQREQFLPRVAFIACSIINEFSHMFKKSQRMYFQHVIAKTLLISTDTLRKNVEKTSTQTILVGSLILLGQTLDRLQHPQEARLAFQEAISIRKTDSKAWLAMGLHKFRNRELDSITDFMTAIELREKLHWPYLLSAFIKLKNRQLEETVILCNQASERTSDKSILSLISQIRFSAMSKRIVNMKTLERRIRRIMNGASIDVQREMEGEMALAA